MQVWWTPVSQTTFLTGCESVRPCVLETFLYTRCTPIKLLHCHSSHMQVEITYRILQICGFLDTALFGGIYMVLTVVFIIIIGYC